MTVISNTTVITNFAAVGQFELLRQIFNVVYVPLGGYQEVLDGLDEGYAFNSVIVNALFPRSPDGWLRLVSPEGSLELADISTLPRRIHRGEAECLVIARHRKWTFLTDDRRARVFARDRGIALSGTIGCLVLGVEQGYCSLEEGNAMLSRLLEQGYRSMIKDLSELVNS